MDPVSAVLGGVGAVGNTFAKIIGGRRARKAARKKRDDLYKLDQNLYGSLEVPDATIDDAEARYAYADPRYGEAQDLVLEQLLQRGLTGDLTPVEKANLSRIGLEQRSNASSARQAALADLTQRGLSASPGELLVASEIAGQGAANRAQQQGLDQEAMAYERAMEALTGGAQLAGGVREQNFGEEFQRRNAADVLNRFNAGLTQNAFNQRMNLANARANVQGQAIGANFQQHMIPAQLASGIGDMLQSALTNTAGAIGAGGGTPSARPEDKDKLMGFG